MPVATGLRQPGESKAEARVRANKLRRERGIKKRGEISDENAVMLDYINELRAVAKLTPITPAKFVRDVKRKQR